MPRLCAATPSGTVTFLFTDVEGISSKATTTITTTAALPLAPTTLLIYPIARNHDRLSIALRGPASVELRLLARKSASSR